MGCCFSSDDDKLSQHDPTEHTRLLNNVVSNSSNRYNGYDDANSSQQADSLQKGDQQSALNRILHQTATNVIDVSALDSHNLEQHEYVDRARQYSSKLTKASISVAGGDSRPCLLADISAPEKVLAADFLPVNDLQTISTATENAYKALHKIKVEHKEDLVVQFVIP